MQLIRYPKSGTVRRDVEDVRGGEREASSDGGGGAEGRRTEAGGRGGRAGAEERGQRQAEHAESSEYRVDRKERPSLSTRKSRWIDRFCGYSCVYCVILSCARRMQSNGKHKIHQTCH